MRKLLTASLSGALLGAALLSTPKTAFAQSEASATGKGIAGGALLGAEVVLLIEAAAGVRPAWPYIVGGVAGGIGGGVGGFFVEQSSARASMYMLAGGMALVIPTTVAVLSATAYEPPADYTEDRGPIDEPAGEPPEPSAKSEPRRDLRTGTHKPTHGRRAVEPLVLRPPPSLVGVDRGLLTLSVPAVEIRDVYSDKERLQLGLKQETELRLPVLSVVF